MEGALRVELRSLERRRVGRRGLCPRTGSSFFRGLEECVVRGGVVAPRKALREGARSSVWL